MLGLHPSSRGFGWILFEDKSSVLDWGTSDIRGDKNVLALKRIELLLDKHQPAVLAMEQHDGAATLRSERIRRLCRAVIARADMRGIAVHCFSRAQISNSRSFRGSRTREEIATAVAECLQVLKPCLPKPRPIWVGERSGMALFSAAACALAYFDTTP